MRSRILAVIVTIGLALAGLAQSPSVERRFDYRDDHDRRRIADVRVKVVDLGGRRALELTISAVGPSVEPMPGFAGIRGGNRQTAEQIDNILSGRFAFAVTTRAEGAAPVAGTWHGGRRGVILERRLRPDGVIDYFSPTPREYPLELIVNAGPLANGRQSTELSFNGSPRLRVVSEVDGLNAKVVEFASLGESPDALLAGEDPPVKPVEEPPPPRIDIADADWNARDLEGKWSLLQKSLADDPRVARSFVAFAAARKDYGFLEMIAVHQPLYDGALAAAWALARADAPQWVRVAVHLRRIEMGHGEAETSKILFKHNPAKALAWHEKYAGQFPEKSAARHSADMDLAAYRKAKVKPGVLAGALPPFDDADLFRHLDAPKTLADFGDRARVKADEVYTHQVVRAIKTYTAAGERSEPWLGKMLALTRHPNEAVRRNAYLAYAEAGESLAPRGAANHPLDEFRRVMDDVKEPDAVREAALLAFGGFRHPQVYLRLHELAQDPTHPAWKAAISTLGNVGDEFTLEQLTRVKTAKLAEADTDHLVKVHAGMRQYYEQDSVRLRDPQESEIARLLERAAYAELTGAPLAGDLTRWTRRFLVERTSPQKLAKAAAEYAPRDAVSDPAALTRQVRSLAQVIANEAKQK